MSDGNTTSTGDVGGAAPLSYRVAERPPTREIRAIHDEVVLSIEGPPAWWQITSATVGAVVWGPLAIAFGVGVVWGVLVERRPQPAHAVCTVIAIGLGLYAFQYGSRLNRILWCGPDRIVYRLTSPLLALGPSVLPPFDAEVLHVTDVAAAPGRLLWHGRRELVLRLLLSDGSLRHVRWRRSRAELDALADDLRDALRLVDARP